MVSIRLLLSSKRFQIVFAGYIFTARRVCMATESFSQQICAIAKSIVSSCSHHMFVCFTLKLIQCITVGRLLLLLLLLLHFIHLAIKLFILSFCMALPSFHTCGKLSFHCSLTVCVCVFVLLIWWRNYFRSWFRNAAVYANGPEGKISVKLLHPFAVRSKRAGLLVFFSFDVCFASA